MYPQACPKAMIAIISNPVNSTVPIACEIFKKAGTLDAKRVFGVTTLDVVRSNAFIGSMKNIDPRKVRTSFVIMCIVTWLSVRYLITHLTHASLR